MCKILIYATYLLLLTACADTNVNPIPKHTSGIIQSENCLGTMALDVSASYAAMGPNHIILTQSNRRNYRAHDYFTGAFTAQAKTANDDYDQSLDNFFGNTVPSTYQALCEGNLDGLKTTKAAIAKIFTHMSEQRASSETARTNLQAKQIIELLEWEIEYAMASQLKSADELSILRENLRAFSVTHSDKAGNLYVKPYSVTPDDKNFRISKANQARFELLQTTVNITLALLAEDRKAFFASFNNYKEITQKLEGKYNNSRDRPWHTTTHSSLYEADHFLKAMIFFHRLNGWAQVMSTQSLHPELEVTYHEGSPFPTIKVNSNVKDPIDFDLKAIEIDFEKTSRALSQRLLYEDSPFLWALHQNLRYEFYKDLTEAHANMSDNYFKLLIKAGAKLEDKQPNAPIHSNSDAHCYSARAYHEASKILTLKPQSDSEQKWCRSPV